MKKIIAAVALISCLFGANAQSFKKGDVVMDLGVGMGIINVADSYYNSTNELKHRDQDKLTFTQKLGFEFCVHEFNEKSSLGIGVSLNNATFGTHNTYVSGSYDYSYVATVYSKSYGSSHWLKSFETRQRSGTGNALAKTTIIDYSVMAKVAFHRSFGERWDTYAALGIGVAYVTSLYGDYSHTTGFTNKTQTFNQTGTYGSSYSFNDLNHVVWDQGSDSQGRFAIAGYIGARYFISSNFGIGVEVGLTSLSLRKITESSGKDKWYNDYSLLNVGVAYKF